MDAVRRLEAVACDGYRAACKCAHICDRLCFEDFFFFFPFATLPSGFFKFPMIGKNMKSRMQCPPTNDSRGPTFDLNFSSAIGWIQARFALPLAQTTSGGEGGLAFFFKNKSGRLDVRKSGVCGAGLNRNME